MGHHEIDQSVNTAADNQPNAAMMQVIIDTHGKPGEPSSKTATLASGNVEQYKTDEQTVNQFPNGVKYGLGDGVTMIEAPAGGKVVGKDGTAYGGSFGLQDGAKDVGAKVLDAHGKVVAELDSNKVMHVHTKNGEYTETRDGQVTFKPSKTEDLSTLHKDGAISAAKMEDYGVSKNGAVTRFPNGIEYDAANHKIVIPSEYPGFSEEKKYSYKDDSLVATVGTAGDGKVLYTKDASGLHIPTADGTITMGANGQLKFEKKAPSSLPDVTITGH